ncbi:hypothetical protein O6H91_09G082000 [Diphasiastrum complanatum]|nr:hypothetical protein O6H91_09G082000 [Diphasiastrum complanatum]
MQVNFLVVFLYSQHHTMMDEDISFSDLPTIYVKESDPYDFGLLLGRHFAPMIQSRATKDPILHTELLPFSKSEEGHKLIQMLSKTNSQRFPHHWDEMRGIADGSGVPFSEVLLLNFRKEVSPFLASNPARIGSQDAENCSDFLIASNNLTIIAHNEDADVSVQDHIFMVHASLPDHTSFVACTYAGELPTCAFGFNNYGVAFTLNAVPLAPEEVVAGGVGRNFISRDLLEATSLDDALKRVRVNELSAGHSYNIMDLSTHKVLNVESASMGRFSICEATGVPFFHANMYLHLHVKQV